MGGDFFLHRDCRFVQIGFSLHRDRGFVEIGFYLHRDCRYIGPCEAKILSPRFARTRRVYVYVYTIEINISNIHHKTFEAWKTFFPKRFLSWGLKTLFVSAGGG